MLVKCPKCGHEQPDGNERCLHCRIIMAKYQDHLDRFEQDDAAESIKEANEEAIFEIAKKHAVITEDTEKKPSPFASYELGSNIILWLLLVYISIRLIPIPMPRFYDDGINFLHGVNLVFHEAGHIIFALFGELITAAGGSINQVLIPLVCSLVFLLKEKKHFAAAVCLWWAGENLLDVAPYINDARDLDLYLITGGTGKEVEGHDWEFILGRLNLLEYDHAISDLVRYLGIAIMLIALIWAAGALLAIYKEARAYRLGRMED